MVVAPSQGTFLVLVSRWMAIPAFGLRFRRASGTLADMKRLSIFVLSALVAGGGGYIYLTWHDLGRAGPPPARVNPAAPAVAGGMEWAALDRNQDGFRVEIPGGARPLAVPAYTRAGAEQRVRMILSDPGGGSSFAIAWADNPPVEQPAPPNTQITLASARDGALARTHTALVSQAFGSRQGYPSLDFEGRNSGGGILDARLILAGRRLYLLVAVFPAPSACHSSDAAHFFDSFQVVDPPRGS